MIRHLALAAAGLGTALALAIPQPAAAAPRYTYWQLITAPRWCVTATGAWYGKPLKLAPCGLGAAQWWTAVPSGYGHGQFYSLVLYDHRSGAFCADDNADTITQPIQAWGCNGTAAQAWFPIRLASGGLAWQNPNGAIITNYKGRLTRGNPILAWRWVGNAAQWFCGPVYC